MAAYKDPENTIVMDTTKGKIVIVKVNADGIQAFDYKFRAAR